MKLIFFRKLIFGVFIGAIAAVILLFISAAVLTRLDDPTKNISLFSEISLIAGAFVCGKAATLGLSEKPLQGLISGVLFALIVLLPSLILSSFDLMSLITMLFTVVSAFAGAMIGRKNVSGSSSGSKRKNVIKRYAH